MNIILAFGVTALYLSNSKPSPSSMLYSFEPIYFTHRIHKSFVTCCQFNRSVELTGKFVAIERYNLFKLVAQNNAVLIAVLSKLSLLERNDIAWKLPAYSGLWEGLREEFELDGRFENLKYKLNLIQDNTKFFLEIMHNQKSDMLEWTIIVLISFEIVLSSMELCEIKPTWVIKALSSLAS